LAPNDPEVNNNYGWYLCDTGRERQSIAYFLNALKSPLYETPERAYTNAGTCALKAGDLDGAQGYLLQGIQLSRDGGMTARFQMARAALQARDARRGPALSCRCVQSDGAANR
jgi:type IV pilus assembly protein PilF